MQRKEYVEGWNDYVKGLEEKSNNIYYKEGYDQANGFEKLHKKKPSPKKYQSKINLFLMKTLFLWSIEVIFILILSFSYFITQKNGRNNNLKK